MEEIFLDVIAYIDEYVESMNCGESYWIARDGTQYNGDTGYGVAFWEQLSGQLKKEAPTIFPDSLVKRGRWEEYESEEPWSGNNIYTWYRCSECKVDALGRCGDHWYSEPIKTKHCPNCGVPMED